MACFQRILPRTKPPLWRRACAYVRSVFKCPVCGSGNISMFGVCFDCTDKSYAVDTPLHRFKRGDKVHKVTGDYTFQGWIAQPYTKWRSGLPRYVTENAEGNNFIMTESQLKPGWPDDDMQVVS